jgi:hypothetical protein
MAKNMIFEDRYWIKVGQRMTVKRTTVCSGVGLMLVLTLGTY